MFSASRNRFLLPTGSTPCSGFEELDCNNCTAVTLKPSWTMATSLMFWTEMTDMSSYWIKKKKWLAQIFAEGSLFQNDKGDCTKPPKNYDLESFGFSRLEKVARKPVFWSSFPPSHEMPEGSSDWSRAFVHAPDSLKENLRLPVKVDFILQRGGVFSSGCMFYNKNTCCSISSHSFLYPEHLSFSVQQSRSQPSLQEAFPDSSWLWRWSSTSGSTASLHHHYDLPRNAHTGRGQRWADRWAGDYGQVCAAPPVPWQSMRTVISLRIQTVGVLSKISHFKEIRFWKKKEVSYTKPVQQGTVCNSAWDNLFLPASLFC